MIERRRSTGNVQGESGTLYGLVTPFDTWTTIGNRDQGGFDERIAPGTFKKTLQERDIVLIHNHDTAMPMARTSIKSGPGHLVLGEDPGAGLRAEAVPTDTSYGRDVLVNAEAGVIRGMSFGFEVIKDSWTDDDGNPSDRYRGTKRTIHEVRLHEVTTTAFPAYETTELSARDRMGDTEDLLRERRAAQATPGEDILDAVAQVISAYNRLPEDQRKRFMGDSIIRAALATYADVYTCGQCGSGDEYGPYCTGCGTSMETGNVDEPEPQYCGSCGGARSAHLPGETRDSEPAETTPDALESAIALVIYEL